jgi:hypothetical protein
MTRYRDDDKKIPHVHIGRNIRCPSAWLERWVEVGPWLTASRAKPVSDVKSSAD